MDCKQFEEQLIDYLEGTINDKEREEMEQHLTSCEACQEECWKLQQVIASLEEEADAIHVPDRFMKNVRISVQATQKRKGKAFRRLPLIGAAAVIFLTVFVGTAIATNGFAGFVDWWKDFGHKQEEQVEHLVQQGLGDKVNVSSVSNNVKITITNVVADDMQTLLYYEVEDLEKEHAYGIDYSNGLSIENRKDIFDDEDDSPVTSQMTFPMEQGYLTKGRLGMAPLQSESGSIHLSLTSVQKFVESEDTNVPEYIDGDWTFKIPVKQHKAIVHKLNVQTEYEGNRVIFDKLTIAPTVTVLTYRYQKIDLDERPNQMYIGIDGIETKNGTYLKGSTFGLAGVGSLSSSSSGWNEVNVTFESLYFEDPTDVKVHFGNVAYSVEEKAEYPFDRSKLFPQSFEYLGTTITIEDVEIGQPTELTMTESLNKSRKYQVLDYHFTDKNGSSTSSSGNSDGLVIDKNGARYIASEVFYRLDELEKPVLYSTESQISLMGQDSSEFIPATLVIDGYLMTEYVDKVVELPLK